MATIDLSVLPINLISKILLYLENPCVRLLKDSNYCFTSCKCGRCCESCGSKPLFTNLRYIGSRPCVLNKIDSDFCEYWEQYLIYPDSDEEIYTDDDSYYDSDNNNSDYDYMSEDDENTISNNNI